MKEQPGAIILAGGQSRRMGSDKALLRLKPDGPRLIELVLAAVAPLVGSIVINTNRPADYAWLGQTLVEDNYKGFVGPLAGLEAGLTASPAHYNLVIACDLPFVNPALLEYLLSQAEGFEAVVPLNREGRPEPLCAVYSRACLPVIRRQLEAGQLKMTGWYEALPVRFIPSGELEAFDPGLRSFHNLNTPEDLRANN